MATNGFVHENRFEFLRERENGRTMENGQTTNNSDQTVTRDRFASSSLQDQMIMVFDELLFIRNEQVSSCMNISDLHSTQVIINEKVESYKHYKLSLGFLANSSI